MTTPHPRSLPPCGRRPCASTQAARTDPLRRIDPLVFSTDPALVRSAVLDVLGRAPRLRILERDDASVHAIIRSAWLRVPVDIELRIDASAGLVHLRVSTPFALRERARPRSIARDLLTRLEVAIRTG